MVGGARNGHGGGGNSGSNIPKPTNLPPGGGASNAHNANNNVTSNRGPNGQQQSLERRSVGLGQPSKQLKLDSSNSNVTINVDHTNNALNYSLSNSTSMEFATSSAQPILNSDRLPTIKLVIDAQVKKEYSNQIKLADEIKRCKPYASDSIKFAFIRDNLVTIATDDHRTYQYLSNNWPEDAFIKGITMQKPQVSNAKMELTLIGVDASIVIDTQLLEYFDEQGLKNVTRIMNKNKKPTHYVKAEAKSNEVYEKLKCGYINIGFSRVKVEAANSINQCFNCQQVGHHKSVCKNKQACMKCSKEHHHSTCQSNEFKCINCGGNHAACSRKCSYLQAFRAQHTTPMTTTTITAPPTQQTAHYMNYAATVKANLEKDKKELFKECVKETRDIIIPEVQRELDKCISNIAVKICEAIIEVLFNDTDKTDQSQVLTGLQACNKIVFDHLKLSINTNNLFTRIINETWKNNANIGATS